MGNRRLAQRCTPRRPTAAALALALVFCSAPHAQTTQFFVLPMAPMEPDCEQDLCFARGEAVFAAPTDVGRFLSEHAAALGLSGLEHFECRRQGWIGESVNYAFPEFAFHCDQVSVQGYPALRLGMTVNFWSNDYDVRLVRCYCVSEVEPLPAPSVSLEAALEEAITFTVSRHPDMTPRSISFANGAPQLVVEPRVTEDGTDGARLAWRATALFASPYGRGRAELEIGVDASTGDVFFVNDVRTVLHNGWPINELFELRAELRDPAAWTNEDFVRWQEFQAFRAGGVALQRRRTESLAQWYPEGESRFIVYFARPMGTDDVATFIGDYALRLETLGYLVANNGEAATDSAKLFAGFQVVSRQQLVDAIDRQRELVRDPEYRPAYGNPSGRYLEAPERAQFSYVIVRMRHRSAAELSHAEAGRRALAVNAIMEAFPLPSH